MADLVGLASGAVGIVSFGIELCKGLIDYYESWKDAENEVMTTYNSIQDLTKILLLVKSTLDDHDLKAEIIVQVHDSIALCEGGITSLSKKLQKIRVSSLRDTVGERLLSQARRALYPFKKSTLIKLQEIVQDLQDRLHFTLTILNIKISGQNFDVVSGQLKLLSVKADKTQIGIGNMQSSLADLDRKIDTIESNYGSEYLRGFYNWLSPVFDVFEKRQYDIFELPGRQNGTWEWLQSTEEFKDWRSRTTRILWCPGQPGVGKTVLSSSIINHLKTQVKQSNIGIAYIYCDYSNALLTVPNLIGSLLQQLFQQYPKVPGGLLELYKIRKSSTTETVRLTLRECSTFLRDVIETFSEVFVVVDGLDECPHREIDDTRDQLVDQLKALPLKAQLLFTSRDLPAIALKFTTDRRLEIHASRQAIEGYLQARINNSKNLRRHIQKKPDLRQAIVETVVQKAEGMFLLVRMYIDLLATKNVLGTVESTLRKLPPGLKDLDKAYDDVITRIQNQDADDVKMAQQILTWLYYAARPLSLQELRHSLAVNLLAEANKEAIELDEDFLPYEEVIASVCAGIVTCHAESNTVSFIHYTTKEYFKRRMDRREVEQFLHLEVSIAETCLMYLSFEREELEQFLNSPKGIHENTFSDYAKNNCSDWDIDICYPLFRYAARYWGDHANGLLKQTTKDLIMKFMMKRTSLAASVQELTEQEYPSLLPFPISISGLYLASFYGLNEVIMMLLEAGQHIDAKNKQKWTALHMAAERGHAVTVQLLVEEGANINAVTYLPGNGTSGSTALHWAARNGHEKVLEGLLENGAEIDLQTQWGETALHWAAKRGQVGAITLLLNKGANLEAKTKRKFTPLLSAASCRQEAAMKILIDRGADLSNTTESGDPLLYLAAEGGYVEVVQLLLETGSDVNGESVLWTAAGSRSQRRDELIRLLLKEGADVSERTEEVRWLHDYKRETALHRGARKGFDTTVRLLLENGAEVDARNDDGETSLHIAATWGREIVVQVLLEQGADVAAKTQAGETALQLAARNGHEGMVRHFLDYLDEEMDSEALLATAKIFKVATAGDEKAMQVLVENGADITIKGWYGQTALHVAAKNGHVALSRFLLENGANINAIDWHEEVPICGALNYGHIEVVRLLIEHKADLRQGQPPLFEAVNPQNGRAKVEIVQLLLENGADASADNLFERISLLHAAVKQGSKPIVELLLEYGAEDGMRDHNEYNALDESIEAGREDISNILLEKRCH